MMTVNSFIAEITARRWDLLRLSVINSDMIIKGKYQVALCRIWRFTAIVVSLRIVVVLLAVFLLAVDTIKGLGVEISVENLGFYAALPIIALVFVAEPCWRVQSYTIEILTSSLGKTSVILASISALGKIMALWLVQPVSFIPLILVTWGLFVSLDNSAIPASWGFFAFSLLTGLAFLVFYGKLRSVNSLDYLTTRLDQELTDYQ